MGTLDPPSKRPTRRASSASGEPSSAERLPESLGLSQARELGRDGASRLWRAFDPATSRHVGVRAPLPGTLRGESPLARAVEREAAVLAKLDGPFVVPLLEVRRVDGLPYVLFGDPGERTLAEALADRALAWTGSPTATAALGACLGRGLAHLHAAGVVHGHVSPGSIGLGPKGRTRLFDLRRARARGIADDVPDVTSPTEYVAPEWHRGEVTPAGDVFGLGRVLQSVLAATAPPRRGPREADGEAVVRLALERATLPEPRHRFASASEFVAALDDCLEHMGELDAEVALERALRGAAPPARPRTPLAEALPALAFLGVTMMGGLVAIEFLWRREPTAPVTTRATGGSAALRVLARPWAEVFIDGARVDTTPIGRPIELAPGRHDVKLVHPAAPEELRSVVLAPGETQLLDVDLRVEVAARPRPAESAAAPPAESAGALPPFLSPPEESASSSPAQPKGRR